MPILSHRIPLFGKSKLPLDIYKNNLVAKFSYYKLVTDCPNESMTVRRSSDDEERDFGFVKKEYINLAKNATITSNLSLVRPEAINDDFMDAGTWAEITSLGWIKFDLNESYNISDINLWHFPDSRIYYDVIVQISNDNINWTNIFNNDSNDSAGQGIGTDSEYSSTWAGNKLIVNQSARYVRIWGNGNQSDGNTHFTEVQILTTKKVWFVDVDLILKFVGNGINGNVVSWANQDKTFSNAVQLTNSQQPYIVKNGIFQFEGLTFGAVGSLNLSIDNYPEINFTNNMMIYTNLKINNYATNQRILLKDKGAGDYNYALSVRASPFLAIIINTTISNYVWIQDNESPTGINKIVASFFAPSGKLEVNNVLKGENNGLAETLKTSLLPLYIGKHSNNSEFFEGNIKTIIMANVVIPYDIMSQY